MSMGMLPMEAPAPALLTARKSRDTFYPLRAVAQGWIDVIEKALTHKQPFDDAHRTCLKYIKGPYDFIWSGKIKKGGQFIEGDLDQIPAPSHQMTCNKAFEYKSIYGPSLYSRNPQFRITGRPAQELPIEVLGDPNDPQVQAMWAALGEQEQIRQAKVDCRAGLMQSYLNYLPFEVGLKDASRMAIDQALIGGMGLLWPTLITPVGSDIKLLGAEWVDTFDFVADPDVRVLKDCYWWAKRRVRPAWEIEAERGLDPGSLKGHYESAIAQGNNKRNPGTNYKRATGQSNDLVEYWEVYSRMGLGHRLKGKQVPLDALELCESFGQWCYLEVAKGIPFPLNLHNDALAKLPDDQLFQAAQWPIPYYLDNERLPFAKLAFHEIPGDLYPTSPLEPGLGELKFLSWCMSYLAGKVRSTCRDFIAVAKSAGEELKTKILHGSDLTLIEIDRMHGTISEVVQFMQHPTMNADIWNVLSAVSHAFEMRVGLSELMYGQTAHQYRSAEEAQLKGSQMNIRPADMLNKTEDFMGDLGRLWAMAARWHISGQDVQPILGPLGGHLWEQMVMGASVTEITREIDLRVEHGSTKKPNFEKDQEIVQGALTVILPQLMAHAQQSGDYHAVNNLLSDWAKAMQADPNRYALTPQPSQIVAQMQQQAQQQQEQLAAQQQQQQDQIASQERQAVLQAAVKREAAKAQAEKKPTQERR